jgi:serine/threonine-protein kinase RsbW
MPDDGMEPGPCAALQIIVPGTHDGVSRLLTRVFHAPGPVLPLSADVAATAEIVLAEVLNNIVEHGYAAATGQIEVELALSDTGLQIRTSDLGCALPAAVLAGTPSLPTVTDDLPEGGFGWYMIRSLVEELAYRREGDRNHLSFCVPRQQSPTI